MCVVFKSLTSFTLQRSLRLCVIGLICVKVGMKSAVVKIILLNCLISLVLDVSLRLAAFLDTKEDVYVL